MDPIQKNLIILGRKVSFDTQKSHWRQWKVCILQLTEKEGMIETSILKVKRGAFGYSLKEQRFYAFGDPRAEKISDITLVYKDQRSFLVNELVALLKEQGIIQESQVPAVKAYSLHKVHHILPTEKEQLVGSCFSSFLTKVPKKLLISNEDKAQKHRVGQLKWLKETLIIPLNFQRFAAMTQFAKENVELQAELGRCEMDPLLKSTIVSLSSGQPTASLGQFMASIMSQQREWIQKFQTLQKGPHIMLFLKLLGNYFADLAPLHNLESELEKKWPPLSLELVNSTLLASGNPKLKAFSNPSNWVGDITSPFLRFRVAAIVQDCNRETLEQEMGPPLWGQIQGIFNRDSGAIQKFIFDMIKLPHPMIYQLETLSKKKDHQNKNELKKFLSLSGELLLGLGMLHALEDAGTSPLIKTVEVPLELCNAFFTAAGMRVMKKFPNPLQTFIW